MVLTLNIEDDLIKKLITQILLEDDLFQKYFYEISMSQADTLPKRLEYILKTFFKISLQEICNPKKQNDELVYYRRLITVLLFDTFKLNKQEIASILQTKRANTSYWYNTANELKQYDISFNRRLKQDLQLINRLFNNTEG